MTAAERREKQLQQYNRRQRDLEWIPLMANPFPCDIDWHHVNNLFVVPVPADIHERCCTKNVEQHRILVADWLKKVGLDLDMLLTDQ
jgi:hypothetical protein